MSRPLQIQLYERCCDGLSRLDGMFSSADNAESRRRIRSELTAMASSGVLAEVEILSRAIEVAKVEEIPVGIWGRPISSTVLFAIELNEINPAAHDLCYEAWHTDLEQNPFHLPGGIATTFQGRELLTEFFQEEGAEQLQSWIYVMLPYEIRVILCDLIGQESFDAAICDAQEILADPRKPISKEFLDHVGLFRRLPRGDELKNARLRLDEIATLLALSHPRTAANGVLDKYIEARLSQSKKSSTNLQGELFRRTYGVPVFQEDVARILSQETGIAIGKWCRLTWNFTNSVHLGRSPDWTPIERLHLSCSRPIERADQVLSWLRDRSPILFSRSLAFSSIATSISRAVFSNRFPTEWNEACSIANWLFEIN